MGVCQEQQAREAETALPVVLALLERQTLEVEQVEVVALAPLLLPVQQVALDMLALHTGHKEG